MASELTMKLSQAVQQWREDLIDIGLGNPLINFRSRATSTVDLSEQALSAILSRVKSKKPTFIVGTKPEPKKVAVDEDDLEGQALELEEAFDYGKHPQAIFVPRTQRDIDRVVRNMASRSSRTFLDKGVNTLHIAVGGLIWTDQDQQERVAPLLLVPMKFWKPGPRQPHALTLTDDDLTVNPALSIKLHEFGIELPPQSEVNRAFEDGGIEAALGLFAAVNLREGWRLSELQVLSLFTFQKEAMYRDLLDNEEAVIANPLVQALGGGGEDFFFEPLGDEQIDAEAPPESSPLVLDADSSQRAAVDAAVKGRSFVLDGPPGTGKSQTISNMIGALIGAGKSVLFVSEKIVALEVVKERLDERGLRSLLFELHSSKTSRKEVAHALGRSLTTKAKAPPYMRELEVDKARGRRVELNSYAQAVNEIRQPLGVSIHEALGIIEQSGSHTPSPEPEMDVSVFRGSDLQTIRDSAIRVERHWPLFLEGEGAVWFGLTDQAELAFNLESLLSALDGYEREYGDLHSAATDLRLQGTFDFDEMLELVEKWASGAPSFRRRPWLVSLELDAVKVALADIRQIATQISTSKACYRDLLGDTWELVPEEVELPTSQKLAESFELLKDLDSVKVKKSEKISVASAESSRQFFDLCSGLLNFSERIGISFPDKLTQLQPYSDALKIMASTDCPPIKWFANRANLNTVREASKILRKGNEEVARHRLGCMALGERSIELPLEEFRDFFAENSSFIDRFSADYRSRKQELKNVANSRRWREIRNSLPCAGDWKQASRKLTESEKKFDGELAGYYGGLESDWDYLFARISDAEQLAKAFLVHDSGALNKGMGENWFVEDVESKTRAIAEAVNSLAKLQSIAGRDLTKASSSASLVDLSQRLGLSATALQRMGKIYDMLKKHLENEFSIGVVSRAMSYLENLRLERPSLEGKLESYGGLLEVEIDRDQFFLEPEALCADLEKRYVWTQRLLELAGQRDSDNPKARLTQEEFAALDASRIPEGLERAAEKWGDAYERFSSSFVEARKPDLKKKLHEFQEARTYLNVLKKRLPEIDQWLDFDHHHNRLVQYGFARVIEAAKDLKLDSSRIAGFLVASVLRMWVGEQFTKDPRFGDSALVDRDEIIGEYRDLDALLKDHAISQIFDVAESTRPRSFQGQAAGILKESEKKARHKPVRDQIAQSDEVIKALHPCFMMSPLAVSQFLPPDIRFDVVIFDEASQVTPADAINCIYRGKAVIAAGDQKQLPPTKFFAAATAEDENVEEDVARDYESILDLMKASGAFNSLTLRWHYRSRHEHLIAFSNASFYEGRLITFPGAVDESADLGVKFFKVADGVYRRSAGRDNPKEAKAVAERVIHHFDTRPGKSLGVVAFSTAQQETLEAAVTIARKDRPDLDQYFEQGNSDRQRGFFIANLESVQGDERDVIIFSIGYGPDETGKVYKNFGPVSRTGGERRLNVAFTRARELVEVVASMDASNLGDVKAGPSEHLRRYLDFAERGPAALHLELGESGLDFESPFEVSVAAEIRSWGYTVQPQVGVAGYRIDIGVRHPQHGGTFLLGVECDGAMYHSSKTARDRDRLRHEILEGLGWTIHHIWGTAWYRHRQAEIDKLRALLDELAQQPISGRLVSKTERPRNLIEVDFEEIEESNHSDWTVGYEVAVVDSVPRNLDVADVGNARKLVVLVTEVVSVEQPVHIETLMQRLRQAADIGRVGQRIRETLEAAIAFAQVHHEGDFLSMEKSPKVRVRRPHPDFPRDVDRIHPLELRGALLGATRDAIGISRPNLIEAVCEIFGWQRKGAKITAVLAVEVEVLLSSGQLIETAGGLRVA
jgi:very-short-patch-repair endonuclease